MRFKMYCASFMPCYSVIIPSELCFVLDLLINLKKKV
jgi:hypothetical protein